MEDVSGFGLKVRIIASVTFPQGFTVSQFADDTDPFDTPEIEVGSSAMGLNGDLVFWSSPKPIATKIAVIPDGDDDANLSALLEANRTSKGKQSARDMITATAIYPDGRTRTLAQGKVMSGVPVTSVANAGRKKSKPYGFVFEGLSKG